jgi:hypothetical protein
LTRPEGPRREGERNQRPDGGEAPPPTSAPAALEAERPYPPPHGNTHPPTDALEEFQASTSKLFEEHVDVMKKANATLELQLTAAAKRADLCERRLESLGVNLGATRTPPPPDGAVTMDEFEKAEDNREQDLNISQEQLARSFKVLSTARSA